MRVKHKKSNQLVLCQLTPTVNHDFKRKTYPWFQNIFIVLCSLLVLLALLRSYTNSINGVANIKLNVQFNLIGYLFCRFYCAAPRTNNIGVARLKSVARAPAKAVNKYGMICQQTTNANNQKLPESQRTQGI